MPCGPPSHAGGFVSSWRATRWRPSLCSLAPASITAVGDSSGVADRGVAVSGGIVYWANNLQGGSWLGTLWSAPLDGTRAPTKELTTPENFLSTGLVAVDGVVYFAVYCRVDQGNQVSGRTHVLPLQP